MEKSRGNGGERVTAAAQGVNKSCVQILKCLSTPPPPVKDLMEAVTLLLGHPAHIAKDFNRVKSVMASPDFLQQIRTRQPEHVDATSAHRAKDVISAYSAETMKKAAAASTGLFYWAKAMTQAVEHHGESQGK
ncbi:dynein heavy chain 6 [Elysia marginata]|uniref:Dynein heavy chain 6 n=1 Tax=Elysia marginata TaxID=1093978 RepID=A0AAV4HLV5_9GAST|nr:dynein heavy chain 6 [Elysia marginata]